MKKKPRPSPPSSVCFFRNIPSRRKPGRLSKKSRNCGKPHERRQQLEQGHPDRTDRAEAELRHFPQSDRALARFTPATNERSFNPTDQPSVRSGPNGIPSWPGRSWPDSATDSWKSANRSGRGQDPDAVLAGPRRQLSAKQPKSRRSTSSSSAPATPSRAGLKSIRPTGSRVRTPPRPIFPPMKSRRLPSARTMSPF